MSNLPKAGKYDYPYRDLNDCIEYIRKANDIAKETSFSRDSFANAIGQSSRGGGYNLMVGSLAMYKLVDTGGGQIIYTDLAKKILHGLQKEQEESKAQAARNIILFADLYDKFGGSPSDEQIQLFLRDKANVDIVEAKEITKEVGKLFKKVAMYLKTNDTELSAKDDGGEKRMMQEQQDNQTVSSTESFKLGTGLEIKLPKENTIEAWKKAKKAIDIILGVEDNQ